MMGQRQQVLGGGWWGLHMCMRQCRGSRVPARWLVSAAAAHKDLPHASTSASRRPAQQLLHGTTLQKRPRRHPAQCPA